MFYLKKESIVVFMFAVMSGITSVQAQLTLSGSSSAYHGVSSGPYSVNIPAGDNVFQSSWNITNGYVDGSNQCYPHCVYVIWDDVDTGTIQYTSLSHGNTGVVTISISDPPPPPSPPTANDVGRCGAGSVRLTVSGGGDDVDGYRWYNSSSGGSPFRTSNFYDTQGTSTTMTTSYWVSSYNSFGESSRVQVRAIINYPPAVNTGTYSPICPGESISLNGSPNGGSWSGDGVSGSTFNGAFPGDYDLTYSVSENGCPASEVVRVIVLDVPAKPIGTGASRCGEGSVDLSATFEGTPFQVSYQWYDTNGQPISGATGSQFTTPSLPPGSYTYRVSLSDVTGCESSMEYVGATVYENGDGGTITTTSNNYCIGGELPILHESESASGVNENFTYKWQMADINTPNDWIGLSGGSSLRYATRSSELIFSRYYRRIATTNACSEDVYPSNTVVINFRPLPTIDPGSYSGVCPGEIINLNGSPAGGTWSGQGVTENKFSSDFSGNYNLTYTVSEYGCSTSKDININVFDVPSLPNGTGATRCGEGSVDLSASFGGSPVQEVFQWYDTNGQLISGETESQFTTPRLSPGSYTYKVSSLSTVTGCESSRVSVEALVYGNDVSGGVISVNNDEFCTGSTLPILSEVSPASGGNGSFTYYWQMARLDDPENWIDLSEGTQEQYSTSANQLIFSRFYRRIAVSYSCVSEIPSNRILVRSNHSIEAGTIESPVADPICKNSNPGSITQIETPDLGNGNYTFEWFISPDNVNWNATGVYSYDYNPGNLLSSTYIKRTDYSCDYSDETNTVFIEVYEKMTPQLVGENFNTCIDEDKFIDVLNSSENIAYMWYREDELLSVESDRFNISRGEVGAFEYSVVASYEDGCFSDPTHFSVNVFETCDYYLNRITVVDIAVPGKTSNTEIDNLPVSDYAQIKKYFDGLGKHIQTVIKHNSPAELDVVQHVEYDPYYRIEKDFLPYTSNSSTGFYKEDAASSQLTFYGQTENVSSSEHPYAKKVLEHSPLNRILEQGSPGEAWQLNGGATIKYDYKSNMTIDNVSIFDSDDLSDLELVGNYDPGTLFENIITDESGHQIIEFTNKQGQTILKRVQAYKNGDSEEWADTYYVYGIYGNLAYVLPPEAINEIGTPATFPHTVDPDIIHSWAFQYKYDNRNRMIAKKVPGADWVYMVYDDRDRLVLTQDGNQRLGDKWSFTKYDALNRPVITGEKVIGTPLNTLRDLLDGEDWLQNYSAYETLGGDKFGYTSNSLPKNITQSNIHSVTYYDNYSFPHAGSYSFISELGITSAFDRVKGQLTGTITKVLGDSERWLKSVVYYDDRYRVIQNHTETLIGTDRTTNQYDFIGNVLETKTTHTALTVASDVATWNSLVNMTNNAGEVSKSSGGYGWNAGVASVETIPQSEGGSIVFRADAVNLKRMIGFSTTNVDANWSSIQYAFYLLHDGTFEIRENGSTNQLTSSLTYAAGDNFKIERVGSEIKYYHNGVLLRTVSVSTEPLIVDVSVHTPGHVLETVNITSTETSTEEAITTTRRFEYDHAGRLLAITHQINDGPEVLLAENNYNELGELIEKNLHVENDVPHQSIDYRYNIRGWLESLNSSTLEIVPGKNEDDVQPDLFGMELLYNQELPGLNNP